MAVERFLDTNIVLYGYDRDAGIRHDVARRILRHGWTHSGTTAISIQVLQEFYVNFVRLGQSHKAAKTVIEDLSLWPVIDNTMELLGRGLELKDRFKVSLWDAMILAAAHVSEAAVLLTEDLNDGQNYGGVVAVNPFHHPADF